MYNHVTMTSVLYWMSLTDFLFLLSVLYWMSLTDFVIYWTVFIRGPSILMLVVPGIANDRKSLGMQNGKYLNP